MNPIRCQSLSRQLPFVLGALAVVCRGAAAAGEPLTVEQLAPVPRPADYVTVRGETLAVGEQTVRFWGMSVPFPMPGVTDGGSAREINEAAVARLSALGITLVRVDVDPTGAQADAVHHFVHLGKLAGVRVWAAGAAAHMGQVLPADVAVLDDPASAPAWQAAMEQWTPDGLALNDSLARVWDPRLELLGISRLRANARQFNPEAGLRWSEDPVVALWDLAGVERWRDRMQLGEWHALPVFFRKLLLEQWNAWLHERFGTDERLDAAWGTRLPDESLEKGTILLLPLRDGLSDAPQRAALELPTPVTDVAPNALSAARRKDVDEFLSEIWRTHKQREEAQFRLCGDGARRAPLLWRTEDDETPNAADAADSTAFRATLTELLAVDTAPAVAQQPPRPRILLLAPHEPGPPHRADLPWRLLSLNSAVQWNAVCWDGFADVLALPADARLPRLAPLPSAFDASLFAAGVVFRAGRHSPASEPTAVRGDLTLDSPFVAAACRTLTLDPATVPFAEGVAFDFQRVQPANLTLVATAVSAALVTTNDTPLAEAPAVTLVFGTDSRTPDVQLTVRAGFLARRRYRILDGSHRELSRGVAESTPFVFLPTNGAFRVEFTR